MKKLGFIVNPIAGMGGRVGLKGSDGPETLRQARQLGARTESPQRAVEALRVLSQHDLSMEVLTYPGDMGESECREVGFSPTVLGTISNGRTVPEDTERAACEMLARGVDLLLFAGGDGTARNICNAVDTRVPALGIPAGVKIHSAVYAVNPRLSGQVAAMFMGDQLMNVCESEVMDIDEEAFRNGIVSAKLYGYLRVPEEKRYVQSMKAGGKLSEVESLEAIAADVVGSMDGQDRLYLIGPGTTTRAVMEYLQLENTLLGVDVVREKQLVAADVTESELLNLIQGHKTTIIVTAIGGQGHVFGRGNQQLSPQVIRQVGIKNITIIATQEKLASFSGRPLLVDTGDAELDAALGGYQRVTTGWSNYTMVKVGYG